MTNVWEPRNSSAPGGGNNVDGGDLTRGPHAAWGTASGGTAQRQPQQLLFQQQQQQQSLRMLQAGTSPDFRPYQQQQHQQQHQQLSLASLWDGGGGGMASGRPGSSGNAGLMGSNMQAAQQQQQQQQGMRSPSMAHSLPSNPTIMADLALDRSRQASLVPLQQQQQQLAFGLHGALNGGNGAELGSQLQSLAGSGGQDGRATSSRAVPYRSASVLSLAGTRPLTAGINRHQRRRSSYSVSHNSSGGGGGGALGDPSSLSLFSMLNGPLDPVEREAAAAELGMIEFVRSLNRSSWSRGSSTTGGGGGLHPMGSGGAPGVGNFGPELPGSLSMGGAAGGGSAPQGPPLHRSNSGGTERIGSNATGGVFDSLHHSAGTPYFLGGLGAPKKANRLSSGASEYGPELSLSAGVQQRPASSDGDARLWLQQPQQQQRSTFSSASGAPPSRMQDHGSGGFGAAVRSGSEDGAGLGGHHSRHKPFLGQAIGALPGGGSSSGAGGDSLAALLLQQREDGRSGAGGHGGGGGGGGGGDLADAAADGSPTDLQALLAARIRALSSGAGGNVSGDNAQRLLMLQLLQQQHQQMRQQDMESARDGSGLGIAGVAGQGRGSLDIPGGNPSSNIRSALAARLLGSGSGSVDLATQQLLKQLAFGGGGSGGDTLNAFSLGSSLGGSLQAMLAKRAAAGGAGMGAAVGVGQRRHVRRTNSSSSLGSGSDSGVLGVRSSNKVKIPVRRAASSRVAHTSLKYVAPLPQDKVPVVLYDAQPMQRTSMMVSLDSPAGSGSISVRSVGANDVTFGGGGRAGSFSTSMQSARPNSPSRSLSVGLRAGVAGGGAAAADSSPGTGASSPAGVPATGAQRAALSILGATNASLQLQMLHEQEAAHAAALAQAQQRSATQQQGLSGDGQWDKAASGLGLALGNVLGQPDSGSGLSGLGLGLGVGLSSFGLSLRDQLHQLESIQETSHELYKLSQEMYKLPASPTAMDISKGLFRVGSEANFGANAAGEGTEAMVGMVVQTPLDADADLVDDVGVLPGAVPGGTGGAEDLFNARCSGTGQWAGAAARQPQQGAERQTSGSGEQDGGRQDTDGTGVEEAVDRLSSQLQRARVVTGHGL